VREIGRLAVGYRSIRTQALRWIGFSEDDAKINRPVIAGRKIPASKASRAPKVRRQSRIQF
jgi:hypothetical protein